jgi:hypothetical protein
VKIELSQLFLRVTIVDLLDAQGVLLWIDLPLRQNKTAPPTYDNINPALEREAHVRTPIIEGKDAAAVEHDKDRTMAAMDNESALRLQHLKVPASTNSLLGTSISVAPVVASAHGVGFLSRYPLTETRKGTKIRATPWFRPRCPLDLVALLDTLRGADARGGRRFLALVLLVATSPAGAQNAPVQDTDTLDPTPPGTLHPEPLPPLAGIL